MENISRFAWLRSVTVFEKHVRWKEKPVGENREGTRLAFRENWGICRQYEIHKVTDMGIVRVWGKKSGHLLYQIDPGAVWELSGNTETFQNQCKLQQTTFMRQICLQNIFEFHEEACVGKPSNRYTAIQKKRRNEGQRRQARGTTAQTRLRTHARTNGVKLGFLFFGSLVSIILVYWFQHFWVSNFQRFTKFRFHVFWKILIPCPRCSRNCWTDLRDLSARLFQTRQSFGFPKG